MHQFETWRSNFHPQEEERKTDTSLNHLLQERDELGKFQPKRRTAMDIEGNTATGYAQIGPFNPEDAMQTRTFFEKIADTVTQASELSKTVQAMRVELDGLKADIERVRSENTRLDIEVIEVRSQRDDLRNELSEIRHELRNVCEDRDRLAERCDGLGQALANIEGHLSETQHELNSTKVARDDAWMRVMELEEGSSILIKERDEWRDKAEAAENKLATLKSIFN